MISTRAIALIASLCVCGSAQAAVNWCDFVRAAPSSSVTFEQSAALLGSLGCNEQAQQSAHLRSWKCTNGEGGDTGVILYRVTESSSASTMLVIESRNLATLDAFRSCSSGSLPMSEQRRFDPGSIPVRDRASIWTTGYRTVAFTLLGLGDRAFAVAAYPEHLSTYSALAIAEVGLFGVERELRPSTRAEVAGENVIDSPASTIVAALQRRGANVIERDPEIDLVETVILTPPVGLQGVRQVEVSSVNDHVEQIVYRIETSQDYLAFVQLLDDRYGRSSEGPARHMTGCQVRHWASGHVELIGARCAGDRFELSFVNSIASRQLAAYQAHLRRPAEQPAEQRRIDPDNL